MKKKIMNDVMLSILASFIPIFTLQFLFLPLVATKLDDNMYGYLITIVAWMNLSALTLGSVLNNSRLIYNDSYNELNIKGDYKLLLFSFSIFNIFVMSMGLWYFDIIFDWLNIVTIICTSMLLLINSYGLVEFRLNLNYKNILLESIFSTLGYGIGIIIFLKSGYWQFIYLFGSIFSFLFIFKKTNILLEPFKKTILFKKTTTQTLALLIAGSLNAITVYIDKLLLFPLLGGMSVSVYYTATILGKTIALVIGPITGVFLSYLSKMKKIESKSFVMLLVTTTVAGVIGYGVVLVVSEPLLSLLYPQFVEEAIKYIYITTFIIVIVVICDIINPVVLKFRHAKWQIVINLFYISLYLGLSLSFLRYNGLMGFCIGILLASVSKLLIMILIYYFTNSKSDKMIKDDSEKLLNN